MHLLAGIMITIPGQYSRLLLSLWMSFQETKTKGTMLCSIRSLLQKMPCPIIILHSNDVYTIAAKNISTHEECSGMQCPNESLKIKEECMSFLLNNRTPSNSAPYIWTRNSSATFQLNSSSSRNFLGTFRTKFRNLSSSTGIIITWWTSSTGISTRTGGLTKQRQLKTSFLMGSFTSLF